jgi:hypothetical protein
VLTLTKLADNALMTYRLTRPFENDRKGRQECLHAVFLAADTALVLSAIREQHVQLLW